MIMITSGKNQILKIVKSLKMKKNRDKYNMFFIEGTRLFNEAVASKIKIINVFMSETFSKTDLAKEIMENETLKKTLFYIVVDEVFETISDTENPQGILAVLETFQNNDIKNLKNIRFAVILDSLGDPGNVGTIIRTADAAGADGIILSKNCADIFNPKVIRATMGSVFHIPIFEFGDIGSAITYLKEQGVKVFATHIKGKDNFYEIDYSGKTAFVIGNEANGLNDDIVLLCDETLKIPMPGKTESLNASVAASVLMYEKVRQTYTK